MADNDGGTSGLGWFLAGLGIGTLVGVLYAPKAGKETREDIANSALEAKQKAAELVEQGRQKATEYVEQGRLKANELVEQGKQQATASIDKGREYYDKGRTQWTQYVEKGKNLVNDQQAKVGAAVDAGKEAYVKTTANSPTETPV